MARDYKEVKDVIAEAPELLRNIVSVAPGRWTYRDFNNYLRYIQTGKFREAGLLAGKILVAWEFSVALEGKDPMRKLPLEDAIAVLKAIPEMVDAAYAKVPKKLFKADLSKWTWDDFAEFQEASDNNDIKRVEEYIRQVVTFEGEPLSDDELTCLDGVAAMICLREAIGKVVQGKN